MDAEADVDIDGEELAELWERHSSIAGFVVTFDGACCKSAQGSPGSSAWIIWAAHVDGSYSKVARAGRYWKATTSVQAELLAMAGAVESLDAVLPRTSGVVGGRRGSALETFKEFGSWMAPGRQ